MVKVNITIEGHTGSDVELALGEVTRLVSEGYRQGRNTNETGSYSFYTEGEDEEEEEEEDEEA